jgi:malate dehydrogenase (quinone)
MSFVRGVDSRNFLSKRFEALSSHPLYYGMDYSEDKKQIGEWIPLVMEGRDLDDVVAATSMVTGMDVDYGALTKDLRGSLQEKEGFSIHFFSRVQDLQHDGDWHEDAWNVKIRDEKTGEHRRYGELTNRGLWTALGLICYSPCPASPEPRLFRELPAHDAQ